MEVERKDHKKTMEVNKEICKRIYEILKTHKGKDNAIPSKMISSMLGFSMEDTQVYCRTYIAKTMEMFKVPIISCSKGYFIAVDRNELSDYCDSMDNRIRGINQTKNKVIRYFNENMK